MSFCVQEKDERNKGKMEKPERSGWSVLYQERVKARAIVPFAQDHEIPQRSVREGRGVHLHVRGRTHASNAWYIFSSGRSFGQVRDQNLIDVTFPPLPC